MPRLVWIDAPGTSRGAKHSGAWRRRSPRVECSTRLLWASLLEGPPGGRGDDGLRSPSPAHLLLPDRRPRAKTHGG